MGEQAGVENNLAFKAMWTNVSPALSSSSGPDDFQASSSPSGKEGKRGKKPLKTAEIIEMQELMVDKMHALAQAATKVLEAQSPAPTWRAEVALQMVQALASAAVEHRYGTSSEEMTMAGLRHTATLQKSERFMRATEKQQEILMSIAKLCGQ